MMLTMTIKIYMMALSTVSGMTTLASMVIISSLSFVIV